MKKTSRPFDSVTAAASRREANRYLTPNGKERHVDEASRNAFDYLITEWDGTDLSARMNMVQVEDRQTNLDYLAAQLFYCTDRKCPTRSLNFWVASTSTSTISTRFMAIHTPPLRTRSQNFYFSRQRRTINDL